MNFLKEALNKITDAEKIPDIWRKSILIPIYKNKGDILNCGNYRGIKLMWHSLKLYERVHENRLRNIVSISEEQFGFMKGKPQLMHFCAKTTARKIQRRTARLTRVYSLIWKKPTTEFRGKNCIGACETRGCQRSTSDW